MRGLLRWAAVAAFAVAVVAPGAMAASSVPVAGVIVPTGATPTVRTAGTNLVFEASGTHAWSGSMTGTSTVGVHFVVHDGQTLTYQGFVTFTGTTPCGTGTVLFEAQGSGAFPGPASGRVTTIDRADATVAMHADLDTVLFLTPAGAVLTYTGDVRCG